MLSLMRSLSVALSVAALSLQGISPSLGESVPQEQLIAQQTTVVEITDLTIKPPLSKEQEEKMVEIDQEYQPKLEEALKTYAESVESFQDLLGTNPRTRTLRSKHEKMLENRLEVQNLAFNRLMDFRDVLTPEQQKSLSDDIGQLLGK
ncbi:MAG: Spy/CpxP family protein refolding chaperone [Microcystaceae cyanobacterium]